MTEVSVVIPCHDVRRFALLVAAVDSALAQRPRPAEVVVVVDHNEDLLDRARRELPGARVLANRYGRGASGGRNTGVAATGTPIVALLDDDACARAGWLASLVAPFEDPAVVGTGGGIRPVWQAGRPVWFPDALLWAVGGAYPGLPTGRAPVRNVWSASMAVRRDVFDAVGGFRDGFGKVGDRARPEDTDLCLRMADATAGTWIFVPDAVIDHQVPAGRATYRSLMRRCFQEGGGKVELARLNRGRRSLGSERDYLRRTVPRAVGRDLRGALRQADLAAAARAGCLVTGMLAAGLGGAVEVARAVRRPGAPGRGSPVGRAAAEAGR